MSWQSEYDAMTTNGGVVTLDDWSQVQLTGADRGKFLHNMCTNDIGRLEAGQVSEAFLLDVKGKIVAHLLVVAGADAHTLLSVPGQAQRIVSHLDRYIIREDVQLANVSDDFAWHLLVGPQAGDISGGSALSVSSDLLWPGGWLVRTAKSELLPWGDGPLVDTASPVWTALRTESFFPVFGSDFNDSHLPQEINRDARAISFTKGCYLGQETVARIDALGHVNKKLVLVKFSGDELPPAGTKLTVGEQEVGTITTVAWSPRLAAPLAIAMVRRGSNDVGTKLECDTGTAEVVPPVAAVT